MRHEEDMPAPRFLYRGDLFVASCSVGMGWGWGRVGQVHVMHIEIMCTFFETKNVPIWFFFFCRILIFRHVNELVHICFVLDLNKYKLSYYVIFINLYTT